MAEAKIKKSWYKQWWAIVLFVIIGLVILAGLSGNKNTPASSLNSNAINTQANPTPTNNGKSATSPPDYPCPDLSTMNLQGYSSLMQTWTAQAVPYKSGNLEVVYSYASDISGKNVIYCDVGSAEGENANWVYCGDFLRPIIAQYTDAEGKIIKKRSIQVTFDKSTKQYLATKCDVYGLY